MCHRYTLTYPNTNLLLLSLDCDDYSLFLGVIVTPKPTLGRCITCGIDDIATIHLECRHVQCCLKCMYKCRECKVPGCTQKHPNHVRIYLGK